MVNVNTIIAKPIIKIWYDRYTRLITVVPEKSNDPNRILVVGSIMGQVGVVTWEGYDTHQQGRNSEGV